MKRNGFTLVELLAVIVILAIIAVIAVPSILGIIERSREDAFKANVRSAVKAAGLAITQDITGTLADRENNLEELNLENSPFLGGTWYYDSTTKKIYITGARDNADISLSRYVISGSSEEINNNEVMINRPNKGELLTSKMVNGTTTGTLGSNGSMLGNGYIRGTNPNNYVHLKVNNINTVFRVVRVFDDGSLLIVTQNSIGNQTYYWRDGSCDFEYYDGCKNNFSDSDIKTYLNTTFYQTINNKNLIKYNSWDTRLTSDGITYSGIPLATISKEGLITLKDYLTVANVGIYASSNNYLGTTNWWLGTGYSSGSDYAWLVDGFSGNSCVDEGVYSGYEVRPALVLSPGVTIIGGTGTSGSPYTIE